MRDRVLRYSLGKPLYSINSSDPKTDQQVLDIGSLTDSILEVSNTS